MRARTHTHIDEHWVADCPSTLKNSRYFAITQYKHKEVSIYDCDHYSLSLSFEEKMTTTVAL